MRALSMRAAGRVEPTVKLAGQAGRAAMLVPQAHQAVEQARWMGALIPVCRGTLAAEAPVQPLVGPREPRVEHRQARAAKLGWTREQAR